MDFYLFLLLRNGIRKQDNLEVYDLIRLNDFETVLAVRISHVNKWIILLIFSENIEEWSILLRVIQYLDSNVKVDKIFFFKVWWERICQYILFLLTFICPFSTRNIVSNPVKKCEIISDYNLTFFHWEVNDYCS
jgi:hypothetical protein